MDVPAFRVGVIRKDMSSPGEAWSEFFEVEGAPALMGQPGVSALALFPAEVLVADDEAAAGTKRYDAGVIAPEGLELPAALLEQRIAAGRYACATYIGPVENLGSAWEELSGEWLAGSGETLRDGLCFEVYRSGPDTPPEEMRTNLFIPIAYK